MLKGIVGAALIAGTVMAAKSVNRYHPAVSPLVPVKIEIPKECTCDAKGRLKNCKLTGAVICVKDKKGKK